jgi:thiamine-monophosphate kinase
VKLSQLGEFGFISRIETGAVVRPGDVVRGIGDDCAVTRGRPGWLRLVTTDLLVERVHFLRGAIHPRQLGAKALAVNLSDIAAMGGIPLDAYVSIAVPTNVPVEELDEIYAGLKLLAAEWDVNLLGGDTTASLADLVVNVALTGEVEEDRVLYRSGARPGDTLFVTGTLGDSRGGLDAILNGRAAESDAARELVRRHHEPRPHLREGRLVAACGLAHAMIDVSDGLSADLPHVCERSRVGVEVFEAQLPLSPELEAYASAHGADAAAFALSGGEDYVLLLAGEERLPAALAGSGTTVVPIGRVVGDGRREFVRRSGDRVPLASSGWDHFRSIP